jgi:hypothetical protein
MSSHLADMKDSWSAHFKVAMTLAYYSLISFFVLVVHAFVPSLFPTTGSQYFKKIQKILQDRNAI